MGVKTNICIDSTGVPSYANVVGYAIYKDVPAISKIKMNERGGSSGSVIVGEDAKVFMYTFKNDKIYLYQEDIIIQANPANLHHLLTDFKEVSEKELVDAIKAL